MLMIDTEAVRFLAGDPHKDEQATRKRSTSDRWVDRDLEPDRFGGE
jgi:hypothetical protein